jgi:hypothetical protein
MRSSQWSLVRRSITVATMGAGLLMAGGPLSLLAVAAPAPLALSPRSGLDLDASPGRCNAMARELLSVDPARWREAQLRLASAGPVALRALDRPGLLRTALGRQRVREVLRLGLLLSVPVSELDRHPRLRALIAEQVEWGRVLARALSRRSWIATPDSVEVPQPAGWTEPGRRVNPLDELLGLRGFAVPAALAMLHDDRPAARVYGCVVLYHLGAVSAADSLAPLLSDSRGVRVSGGDYIYGTTVAQTARENTQRLVGARGSRFRFEAPLELVAYQALPPGIGGLECDHLLSAIRSQSRSLDAATWDEWWDAARPTWNDWWHMEWGRGPASAEAWRNVLNEYDGYRVFTTWSSNGPRRLDVEGPSGTRCRVLLDGTEVGTGPVPFHWQSVSDFSEYAIDEFPHLIVEAVLPDRRVWRTEFMTIEPAHWRIELLAEPKKRQSAPRIERTR